MATGGLRSPRVSPCFARRASLSIGYDHGECGPVTIRLSGICKTSGMPAPTRGRFRRRTPPPAVEQAVGRAMRVDDAIREFREQRARRRGLLPTVIPYTGYGAPGWVRVLGRVLLVGKPGAAAKAE